MRKISLLCIALAALFVLSCRNIEKKDSRGIAKILGNGGKWELENEFLKLRFSFDRQLMLDRFWDKSAMAGVLEKPSPFIEVNYSLKGRLLDSDILNGKTLCLRFAPDRGKELVVALKMHLSGRELLVETELFNEGAKDSIVSVKAPYLKGVKLGDDPGALWYCLPYRGGAINNANAVCEGYYGEHYPMQFMAFFNPVLKRSAHIICKDKNALHKNFYFRKNKNIDAFVSYSGFNVPSKGSRAFPEFALGASPGSWRNAVNSYRHWVKGWRKSHNPPLAWVRRTFLWERLYFLGKEELAELLGNFGNKGCIVDSGAWWWGEKYWEGLGDYKISKMSPENLKENMKSFQENGIPIGIYLSPGLLYLKSDICKKMQDKKQDWFIKDKKGKNIFYHDQPVKRTCIEPMEYRVCLVDRVVKLYDALDYDFIYWDTQGYSIEGGNRCYAKDHGHPVPQESPLQSQIKLFKEVRAVLPGKTAFFTEFLGGDVYSQYIDGSITHVCCENDSSAIPIDLYRFCFPDIKCFSYFPHNPKTLRHPIELLKFAFFNGDAVWTHQGKRWVKSKRLDVLKYMRNIEKIMADNWEAFSSAFPEPLVETESRGVWANRFPAEDYVIYTFYNFTDKDISGRLLKLSSRGVEKALNLSTKKPLEIEDGIICGTVKSKDVIAVKVFSDQKVESEFLWRDWNEKYSCKNRRSEQKNRNKNDVID